MKLIRRDLGLCLLVLALSTGTGAQVTIDPGGQRFQSGQIIPAKLINRSAIPIMFCLEAGQVSYHGDQMEATPMPFLVQAPVKRKWKHLFRRRWQTQLIGPDIGSIRVPDMLDPGKIMEFPFRLNGQASELRLVVWYWQGENQEHVCDTARSEKKAVSRTFRLDQDVAAR